MVKTWVMTAVMAVCALGAAAAPAATFDFNFTAPVVQFGQAGDTYLGSGQLFADDAGGGVFTVTNAIGSTTIQGYEEFAWGISGGEGSLTFSTAGFTADGLVLFGDSGPGAYSFSLNPGSTSYAIQLGEVGAPAGTLTIAPAGAGAVPEPASWALMLCGFGAIGAAMRRRDPLPVRL